MLKALNPGVFDPFCSMFEPQKQWHCGNNECKGYGYVTVVGIHEVEEKSLPTVKK